MSEFACLPTSDEWSDRSGMAEDIIAKDDCLPTPVVPTPAVPTPKLAEKRPLETSDASGSSEDGYTKVTRKRRPKVTVQEDICKSPILQQKTKNDVEVCLTSLKVLPKQMALARLLRDCKITNIINIKYRSPYKVFVQLDCQQQAENLIKCTKWPELDVRAHLTDKDNLSYGIIKGVDLDLPEEEIRLSLNSSIPIISIKRLRRVDNEGKWIDSETVRICFKSPTCPPFITAYGCRFTVERYVFPVTQCSNCWKFGHSKRFCPLSKSFCPKCGQPHENCETETYRCPNCKGPHMAIEKTCPFFTKEKAIRNIMSEENITYKKALEVYVKKKEEKEIQKDHEYQREFPPLRPPNRTMTTAWATTTATANQHVIRVEQDIEQGKNEDNEESNSDEDIVSSQRKEFNKTRNKKKQRNLRIWSQENEEIEVEIHREQLESTGSGSESKDGEQERRKREGDVKKGKNEWRFEWRRIFENIKDIILSNELLGDKLISIVKLLFEEISSVVVKLFAEGELLKRMFHTFQYR